MAIEATYALNNYLLPPLKAIEPNMVFYPGNSAPESTGHTYVLYSVTQNTPFELWMINTDSVRYKIIHTDFEKMQKCVSSVLSSLNVENPNKLFSGVTDDGRTVQPLHTFAISTTPGNDFFADSTEYYFTSMMVTYTYKLI